MSQHTYGRPIIFEVSRVKNWFEKNRTKFEKHKIVGRTAAEFADLLRKAEFDKVHFDKTDRIRVTYLLTRYGLTTKEIGTLYGVTHQAISHDISEGGAKLAGCHIVVRRGRKPKEREIIYPIPPEDESVSPATDPRVKRSEVLKPPRGNKWHATNFLHIPTDPDTLSDLMRDIIIHLGEVRNVKNVKSPTDVIRQVTPFIPDLFKGTRTQVKAIQHRLALVQVLVPQSIIDTLLYYYYFRPNGMGYDSAESLSLGVLEYIEFRVRELGSVSKAYEEFNSCYLEPLKINLTINSFHLRYRTLRKRFRKV